MKTLFSWKFFLLIFWPYAALAANLFLIRIALAAWFGGLLCTLAVTVLSIRCALHQREAFAAAQLGMLLKLLHIPAYVLCLLLAPVLWVAPPLLLMLLATNMCMLVATSAHTLRGTYLVWRGGRLSSGWAIALALSQCVFVLDVPGSIAICAIEKRRSH